MKNLQGYFDTLLEETPSSFHRYMFNRIDWDNRLIGLVGPRGVEVLAGFAVVRTVLACGFWIYTELPAGKRLNKNL